jgi:hypothetical protein
MTENPTPTDEELSLVLDGEAGDELVARVEGDPAARARLEELRRTTDALRASSVPPLADGAVDDLVATALDTPIAPGRPAAPARSRAVPWLVAASVLILVAVGLTLVWSGRSADDEQAGGARSSDATAEAALTESAPQGDASAGASAPLGGHGSPTTTPSAQSSRTADLPVPYLGAYASGDELRAATATSFAAAAEVTSTATAPGTGSTTKASSAPTDAAVDRCAQQLQVTLNLKAPPTGAGYATVDGRDVVAYEFPATSARDGKDTTLVAAVGVAACDQVVIFER